MHNKLVGLLSCHKLICVHYIALMEFWILDFKIPLDFVLW